MWPRWGAAVVALPDGTTVVCGGASPEGPVEPCERFTDSGPAPGFSAVVDASGDGDATLSGLTDGAEGAAGTLLPNGMAIFVGGRAGDPSAAVRVFNP